MTNVRKTLFYILGAFFFFLFGVTLFFIKKEWLIIKFSFRSAGAKKNISFSKDQIISKKDVDFYFWKNGSFHKERSSVMWLNDNAENIKHVINNWLLFLQTERMISKKVILEAAAFTKDGNCVYLSFDRSFLGREWSIFKKINFIHSMLKTVSCVLNNIGSVVLFVDGRSMEDDHLDFSQPWPMEGFF